LKRELDEYAAWGYRDALRLQLLGSLRGGLDDGRVVAAAKTSVAGDKHKRNLLDVADLKNG
jgi:hypothetical protein